MFTKGTKTKALIFALTMMAAPAWSDAVKLFVVQDDGGIIERPGAISVEAAATGLGAPPPGTTGIVMEDGEPPRWTSAPASEVHTEYGGQGDHVVELFPENGGDPVPPIEVFPEGDMTGAITPAAGNWIGRVISQSLDNCPPETAEVVSAQLAAMDGSPIQPPIDEGFSPARHIPEFTWVRTSANRWAGELVQGDISRVDWTMEIMSSDRIKTEQRVQIAIPGGAVCTSQTSVDYLRQ